MNHVSALHRLAWTAGLLLPVAAQAQLAFTNQDVNLRAGPAPDYPVVAVLTRGVELDVAGCTQGYQWCDVILPDGLRGWVYAQSLSYPYQGQVVPLPQYATVIGVPLVSFVIGNYWGSHYRDRPWYNEPRYWHGRPPPRFVPPPVAVQPRAGPEPYHRNRREDHGDYRDGSRGWGRADAQPPAVIPGNRPDGSWQRGGARQAPAQPPGAALPAPPPQRPARPGAAPDQQTHGPDGQRSFGGGGNPGDRSGNDGRYSRGGAQPPWSGSDRN